MKTTTKSRTHTTPEIVYREGEPVAVILDIADYEELLDRLEDEEDREELRRLRGQRRDVRPLDDFLAEYSPDV